MDDKQKDELIEKLAEELYRVYGQRFMDLAKDDMEVAMRTLGLLIEKLLTLAMINFEANNLDFAEFAADMMSNAGLSAGEVKKAMRSLLTAQADQFTCRPMH